MISKWRKARLSLGCVQIPRTLDDDSSAVNAAVNTDVRRLVSDTSAAVSLSSPTTPTASYSGLRLSRNSSKSSKQKTCAICLSTMIPGHGHAIFTAECSHSFHFNCIASNVKHGNQICPICRAKWKEIPSKTHTSELVNGSNFRANSVGLSRDDNTWMASPHQGVNPSISSIFRVPEPRVFDDDDVIEPRVFDDNDDDDVMERVEVRTYPEVPAIPKSSSFDNFTILIHLKAPAPKTNGPDHDHDQPVLSSSSRCTSSSRAPVDLVTVLDVSGSMAGTKLALLKRAMGFVIQHLGPHDRLSVVAFSSMARRVFPLRRMTDNGRHEALQAVNSLSSIGGTNIAEGLGKGAKVMIERKSKNPVSSIILLSDGQDTYTVPSYRRTLSRTNYKSLVPVCISGTSLQIPVHTFGFGGDHDSVSMHSIAEGSGGTFSFIEEERVIQDAFAQCMGGLLSVVVQGLKVDVHCLYPGLQLGSIKAGSYNSRLTHNSRTGQINVGDLYAEEERDFLVTVVNVPPTETRSMDVMPLLKVIYSYKDPVSKKSLTSIDEDGEIVKIQRPDTTITEQVGVSIEVDRQRNRLKAAEAMSMARSAAERGDFGNAVSILDNCHMALCESMSSRASDPLCMSLNHELKEMQERLSSRQVYEASGRAYLLSGLSSHTSQRANGRGDSTSSTNLSQAYQTPSMADMITRSQTMVVGSLSSSPHPPVRPTRSLSRRPRPR